MNYIYTSFLYFKVGHYSNFTMASLPVSTPARREGGRCIYYKLITEYIRFPFERVSDFE